MSIVLREQMGAGSEVPEHVPITGLLMPCHQRMSHLRAVKFSWSGQVLAMQN